MLTGLIETLNNTTLRVLNIHVYNLFWCENQGPTALTCTQIILNLQNQSENNRTQNYYDQQGGWEESQSNTEENNIPE